MASDSRKKAKAAVTGRSDTDPELDSALSAAHKQEIALRREEHQHKERLEARRMGILGVFFGEKSTAATNLAGAVIVGGFLICGVATFGAANGMASWQILLQTGVTFVTTALAYAFGRASK